MSRRLSPWFDCTTQPPVRSGWYDVCGSDRAPFRLWYSADENGWVPWEFSLFQYRKSWALGLKWRGVLR